MLAKGFASLIDVGSPLAPAIIVLFEAHAENTNVASTARAIHFRENNLLLISNEISPEINNTQTKNHENQPDNT